MITMRLASALIASLLLFPPLGLAAESDSKDKPKKVANAIKAEGTDLAFGGEGTGNGKFFQLEDLAFDRNGNLYVLDGITFDKASKSWVGNALVQKFDAEGTFISQFSIASSLPAGEADAPAYMAVDGTGRIYITKPLANRVEQYSPDGKLIKSIEVPGARGITVLSVDGKEKVAVIGGVTVVVNKKRTVVGGDEIIVLEPGAGVIDRRIRLERALLNTDALASDRAGNFFVLADVAQLYQFDQNGKLLQVLGSGVEKPRDYEGSQFSESVAVSSQGRVVVGSWNDAVLFEPDLQKMARRGGRFNIASGWGRTRFAFDHQDRLWVASTGRNEQKAKDKPGKYFVEKPAIMRLSSNYYDATQTHVRLRDARLIGLMPDISTTLPYQVAHQPGPFPLHLSIAAAKRQLSKINVHYRVLNTFGAEVTSGDLTLPLTDNVAAEATFTVPLPAYGWYSVVADYIDQGDVLLSEATFIGVTPRYPGMDIPANAPLKGGWEDAPRQVFSGLPFMRLHPGKGHEKLDEDIKNAIAAGAHFIVQLTNEADCAPENVRELVTKYKGRVPIYEIINEPNISLKGGLPRYVEIWKTVAPIIREIDPQAKLMGPATVNLDLKWIEGFFAECAQFVDMVSFHDYEGHNSYDENHWIWKIGELRALMAKYGLKDKPLWQTERVTLGVARGNFMGHAQAVLLTYHYDLLETLGIPSDRNQHYYLNEGGYASVPSYVWSKSGPHPGVFAMRTRTAVTKDRPYLGKVDFGRNGNQFFLGLRYGPRAGDDGLLLLRAIGTLDTPVEVEVTGIPEVQDAFGNPVPIAVKAGKATLLLTQMPLYVRLPTGAKVTMPQWNWGKNMASEATITYSEPATNPAAPELIVTPDAGAGVAPAAPEDAVLNPRKLLPELLTDDPFKLLTNGLFETHHFGNPLGSTSKSPRFNGDVTVLPQNLDVKFPSSRSVSAVAIFSERADNAFCALLDYDLQSWRDGKWVTLAEVRAPFPASTPSESFATSSLTWMGDPNRYFHRFAQPITTDALRFVIRRISFGFAPDDGIRGWSTLIKPKLMLKEIEVY